MRAGLHKVVKTVRSKTGVTHRGERIGERHGYRFGKAHPLAALGVGTALTVGGGVAVARGLPALRAARVVHAPAATPVIPITRKKAAPQARAARKRAPR